MGAFLLLIRHRVDPGAGVAITPIDEDGAAEGRIWFKHDGLQYELRMMEAWWAQCFNECSLSDFLGGVVRFGRAGITRDLRTPGTKSRGTILRALLGPFRRLGHRSSLLDVPLLLERAIVDVAAALLALPLVSVLVLAVVIDKAGLRALLPTWITKPLLWLTNIATRQIGDMWIYMQDPWNAARIRVRFEERLYQLMEEIAPTDDEPRADAAFVVAHSMGSVVAYEAMTGSRMKDALDRHFRPRDSTVPLRPALHLFTVGSALNLAWDVTPGDEEFRFARPLPNCARWVNIRAQFDPVALGPLQFPVDPLAAAAIRATQPEDIEVTNQMDVFSDHTAYWDNAEQVIAPMLDRVLGGQAHDELRLDAPARKRRVAALALAKFLAWAAMPVVFVAVAWTGAAVWIMPRASDVASRLHVPLSDWLDKHVFTPLVVAAAVALAAAFIYSTLVQAVWGRWDQRAKYRPAP